MDTAGGLANRDIKVVISPSCVADFDQEMHRMSLNRMEAIYGCTVLPS